VQKTKTTSEPQNRFIVNAIFTLNFFTKNAIFALSDLLQ